MPEGRNLKGQNLKSQKVTTHWRLCILSDPVVELLALHDEEVVPGFKDPALDGDGSGRVHVVSCHHPDGYAGILALLNGVGNLKKDEGVTSIAREEAERTSRSFGVVPESTGRGRFTEAINSDH